jgi:hypothetical protein
MKRKRKKHNKKRNIFFSVIIVVICLISGYLFYEKILIFDVKETGMELIVSGDLTQGVRIDTDALYFGKIPKGANGFRFINVSNYDPNPHIVHIKTYGELAKWVYVEKNDFVIGPEESELVQVSVFVPEDAITGNYTGTLRVEFFNKFF